MWQDRRELIRNLTTALGAANVRPTNVSGLGSVGADVVDLVLLDDGVDKTDLPVPLRAKAVNLEWLKDSLFTGRALVVRGRSADDARTDAVALAAAGEMTRAHSCSLPIFSDPGTLYYVRSHCTLRLPIGGSPRLAYRTRAEIDAIGGKRLMNREFDRVAGRRRIARGRAGVDEEGAEVEAVLGRVVDAQRRDQGRQDLRSSGAHGHCSETDLQLACPLRTAGGTG